MNKMIFGVVMGAGLMAAAGAYANPAQIDARTVVKGDLAAKLTRYNDPDADCPNYGVLMVVDENQKVLGQETVCGAENILAAVQGDETVVYVYARDVQGGLGLYRYIAGRGTWDYYDFKASTITITSMGTEVMVKGFYPAVGDKPQHMSWTWHPRNPAPKQI